MLLWQSPALATAYRESLPESERIAGLSTGQPIWFALPGGGTGRLCGSRTIYPDGTEYVGRGIVPDIVVHPTPAGVRQNGDPVLQAAVDALERKYDAQFRVVFDAIRELMAPPEPETRRIGFMREGEE